ncbi:DivIVA domain-containing protein [Actinomyces trachealis]|uniref:DivIVA domain-containing protein n=1 Tax=Actinomyces trachealis TaxID=2763540 RepID=UPI001892B495|nr:DivIVA domain-containing protein [Actinomyces trachealis]
MTLLTADDVLNKKFQATKFREGYEQDEVDEFLDDVVDAMRQLEAENADLKAKLEAANARIASLSEGKTEAPAAPTAPTPAPAIAEAAPVAVPVAAPATGSEQEPAAAKGMLELAQKLHDEHVANGKAEGERIITEARTTGESIIREAEDQRNRTLAQLEKERSGLEHKIDELRRFETDYRTRLKSFLSGLLNTVDGGGTSVDGVNL